MLACVLAYALALQGFLFALGIGHSAVAADTTAWAGFELCTHGDHDVTSRGTPVQAPVGDCECPFCIACALYVHCPPSVSPQWSKAGPVKAEWLLTAPRLVALFINKSAWPRGPPAAA